MLLLFSKSLTSALLRTKYVPLYCACCCCCCCCCSPFLLPWKTELTSIHKNLILSILYFPIPHNALCLPPKFCINYCCGMLLGIPRPPIVYAKFGGQTECIMDSWKIVNTNLFPQSANLNSMKRKLEFHKTQTCFCPCKLASHKIEFSETQT